MAPVLEKRGRGVGGRGTGAEPQGHAPPGAATIFLSLSGQTSLWWKLGAIPSPEVAQPAVLDSAPSVAKRSGRREIANSTPFAVLAFARGKLGEMSVVSGCAMQVRSGARPGMATPPGC